MKKLFGVLFMLFLTMHLVAQDKFNDAISWMHELLKSERHIIYSLGDTGIIFDKLREFEIENSLFIYYEFKPTEEKIKKNEIYLQDIDSNSIIFKERKDIDSRKILYQVWVNANDQMDLFADYTYGGKSYHSYFSIYFEKKDNAEQFIYALHQAIIYAPLKIEKKIDLTPGTTIRNLDWGMSVDQVKAIETGELIEDTVFLKYKTKEEDQDIIIMYSFENDKLNTAIITYIFSIQDYEEYINLYMLKKVYLNKKYGKPISDEEIWTDESLKGQKSKIGFALVSGKLKYRTRYNTEKMRIILNMYSENSKPNISIAYAENKKK